MATKEVKPFREGDKVKFVRRNDDVAVKAVVKGVRTLRNGQFVDVELVDEKGKRTGQMGSLRPSQLSGR